MALPQERLAPIEESPLVSGAYLAYALGASSWFTGWGMQQVLFAGLVTLVLGMPAELVGTAQLALIFPSFLFLTLGGAVADRLDRRHLLAWLHAAAGLAAVALALALALDALSYAGLIVYALVMGTLSAFALPTRDALLSDVAGASMLRAVSGLTVTQFLSQFVGHLLAGGARFVGWVAAAGLQGLVIAAGIVPVLRLPASEPIPRKRVEGRELLAGLEEVWHSPTLLPVWLLVTGIGLFFMGPYFVVFPLLVRDYYGGSADQLSLLFAMFPVGAVAASMLLLRIGRLPRRGIALALAQLVAACALLVIGAGLPFWGTLIGSTVWGLAGGIFNNSSRSVFQENAPEGHRARVLAVYSLGLFGGGAAGSPLAGVLAGQLGPLGAFRACGLAMMLFVGVVLLTSRLRHVR
jgi:MFS family permease